MWPTHVLTATELCDGGRLGDGPVHALNEDPVASRHSAHLHSVASLGDPQVANLKRGGEERREGREGREERGCGERGGEDRGERSGG